MSDNSKVLEQIEMAQFKILVVPFFDINIPVKVRELTQAQIISCGDISLIETSKDVAARIISNKQQDIQKALKWSIIQHKIVKSALVSPTYEEIISVIGKTNSISNSRELLKELKLKLKQTPAGLRRNELENEIVQYEFVTNLLLPSNFMATIINYSLGLHKSDIKLISEDMLYESAILAINGHNNPSDHFDGNFTAFNKYDINKRAWGIYNDRKSNKGKNKKWR